MTDNLPPNRCRLVLIAPDGEDAAAFEPRLRAAAAGGDVASLILPRRDVDFQAFAERIVPAAQQAGMAVIIAEDTQVAGRVGADGVHLDCKPDELKIAIDRWQGKMTVGSGGATTRDAALAIGEAQPDYIFFGRFGFDTKPEPHRRNLSLGSWWAEMIQIPCIVLGGADIDSVEQVAATGAEFVALSAAVFGPGIDPQTAVATANAILDRTAPRLDG